MRKSLLVWALGLCGLTGSLGAAETYDATTSTLTLDGVIKRVTAESELGEATQVVLKNGGGVEFDAAAEMNLTKTYSIAGEGLDATGVISVLNARVNAKKANLPGNVVGHTLVKRGPGTLYFQERQDVVNEPTRWVVEAGELLHYGADLFGGHSTTTLNLAIDVREGAKYTYANGTSHSPMGPLELTGGQFLGNNVQDATRFWGNTAFKGGVTAHASATPSLIKLTSWAHLGHCQYSNIVFNVETGAKLIVDGVLTNGWDASEINCSLVKRGGGELVLLRNGGWTGGTRLEAGTITVTHPHALGNGPLEVAGDATLNVLAGTTLGCTGVIGAGTLTKTGAGGVNFGSVAAGVTVVREPGEGTTTERVTDGILYVAPGENLVDVAAGETFEATGTALVDIGYEALGDLVKTGEGTLVLPQMNNAGAFQNVAILGGAVAIAADNNLGAGGVTLRNGGALRILETLTLKSPHRATFAGEGVFDVPEGKTLTVGTATIQTSSATLVKKGLGKLYFGDNHYESNGARFNGTTRWVCDEGFVNLPGDPFSGHAGLPSLTLEVNAGAELHTNGHCPVGKIILRGGRLQVDNTYAYVGDGATQKTSLNETLTKWNGFSFNGTIEVESNEEGVESVIAGARCYLAHAANKTLFDVKEGAVLRVETRLHDGFASDANVAIASDFTKQGAGEMILDAALDATGAVNVNAGTLTMGANASLTGCGQLKVQPGAVLRLADGSAITANVGTSDPVLGKADVWFDATRLSAAEGASLTAGVPNLGRAGGTFAKANVAVPTYTANGINGLPSMYCNGGTGLVLSSYANHTNTMTVFMVAEWTSWNYNSGKGGLGHWGGGLSMMNYSSTATDNQTQQSFHTETATRVGDTSAYATGIANMTLSNPARGVGTPYLDHITYDGSTALMTQYTGDSDAEVSLSTAMTAGKNFNIDRVGIGGRLRWSGQLQSANSPTDPGNRMFIGNIGEVLVFTAPLTAAEEARVAAYLKRKWFASSVELPALESDTTLASAVIDVPAGTAAFAGAVEAVGTVIRKTGEGTLAFATEMTSAGELRVEAGSLDLTATPVVASRASVWMDADDADTLTLDGGQVLAVRNKGRAGGAFGAGLSRYGAVMPFPGYAATALNGRGALVFDANAALSLNTYTNETSPRAVHIYAVMQGKGGDLSKEGKGKWGGPLSLYDDRQSGDDQSTTGSFQITEMLNANGVNQSSVYMGQNNFSATQVAGGLSKPYLFVAHQEGRSYNFGYEWAETASDQIAVSGRGCDAAMSATRVNLGGRSTTGGALQWESVDNGNNRTWAGYFGELIIIDRKLTTAEEKALLGYLRKKWLGKGDGSAEPPAFLSGNYGKSNLEGVDLALADGTAVACGNAPVALAGLTTAGTVGWTKVWDGLTPAHATCFTVAGDVSLANINLDYQPLPKEALVVGLGGRATATPKWTITSNGTTACATVSTRASGYWLTRAGLALIFR